MALCGGKEREMEYTESMLICWQQQIIFLERSSEKKVRQGESLK